MYKLKTRLIFKNTNNLMYSLAKLITNIIIFILCIMLWGLYSLVAIKITNFSFCFTIFGLLFCFTIFTNKKIQMVCTFKKPKLSPGAVKWLQ